MPYLKWTDRPTSGDQAVEIAAQPTGTDRMALELALSDTDYLQVADALEPVLAQTATGSELKWELPQGWTLYWKAREGEDRLLLAHPEKEEWVGTLALTPEVGKALIERFRTWKDQAIVEEKFDLGSFSARLTGRPVWRMSNLTVSFRRKAG